MILDGLSSKRLYYRSMGVDDFDILMEFYGDAEVTQYYFFEDTPVNNCKNGIKKQLWRYKTYNSGLALLIEQDTDQAIGMAGILHQDVNDKIEVEVGYGLFKRFWGNGYATEAAIFCRDLIFQKNLSDTAISMIHPENQSSQRVAVRNGMKHRQTLNLKGHEHFIYSITKDEWLELKTIDQNEELKRHKSSS